MKILIALTVFAIIILSSSFAMSEMGYDNQNLPQLKAPEVLQGAATNYSLVNVNNSQYLGGIPGSGYIRTDGSSTTPAQIPFAEGAIFYQTTNFLEDYLVDAGISQYFGTDLDFGFVYDNVAGIFRFSQGSTLGDILTVNENTGLINVYYPINSSKGINSTGKICDSVGCITVGAGTGNCPAGQVVQNTTTGGVQCVDRVDPSITYYVNATSVTGGTITSTQINDTYWYDGITYNVSEGGGVAPLTLYLNYTNVTTFSQWILREYYLGSASHNLQFEIYDYTSATWQSYFSVVGQTGQTWITIPIFDASEHISGGIVQTRIRHIETGITSHRLYIEVAWLVNGGNIGASTNLDGYAKYLFGFNNFAGNGTFTTSQNVTAKYFFGNGSQLTNLNALNLSGTNANQNMNISPYNLTASNFFGFLNWSWIQNIPTLFAFNNTNIAYQNQSNTFTKSNLFQDNITISNGEDLFYDGVMVTPKLVISNTSEGIGTCVFHVNVTDNDNIKITDNNLRDFICFCSTSNDAIAKSTCQISDAGDGYLTSSIVGALSYMVVYGFDSDQHADIRISELPATAVTRYLVCLGPDNRRFSKSCVVQPDEP